MSPTPEGEAKVITCRTCRGSKKCKDCQGRGTDCVKCYYSGRCPKCGGTGVEVVSR